jgi:hypothetical protein
MIISVSRYDDHTMQPGRIERWVDAYGQAWRDKDADAVAMLFTPDATYQVNPTGTPHRGRDAIRAYWLRATVTQQELDLRFGQPIVAGCRAAVEWWAVMRDASWGPQRHDDVVTLPGCLILRFAPGGLCAALREYWNADFGTMSHPTPGWGT